MTAWCIKYICFFFLSNAEITALTYRIVLIAWINCWIVTCYCLPTKLIIAPIDFFITLEVVLLAEHVSQKGWIWSLNVVVIIHVTNVAMMALNVSSAHNHTWHWVHKSRCNTPNVPRTVNLAYTQWNAWIYVLII